jgi:hypothetical protein
MTNSLRSLVLQLLCIAHAIACSVLWYVVVFRDNHVVTVRTWTVLCILWLAWFSAPYFDKKSRQRWALAIGIGLVALYPTYGTLYSFVVWTFGGFAP